MNSTRLTIGSLFSGYGGLDLAVEHVFNARTVWQAEWEDAPSAVLARHWPGVPNLRDVTAVDWASVEPVDIIAGGFPCFVAGTLITTSRGPVPIERVREGDMVLTHKSRWRECVQTMTRDDAPLWNVKVMGAPSLTTTAEHPFYVRRTRTSAPEWVAANALEPGMYAALGAHHEERVTDVPLTPYLIGRWLGDGWTVTHPRAGRANSIARRVHWCCAPHEASALEEAFADAGLRPTRSAERTVVKYIVQAAELADLLDQFGKGASGKYLPEWVHQMPIGWQAELLRGWLDSDGDVKRDGTVNGTSVSKALVIGMARLARFVYGKPVSIHEGGAGGGCVIEGRAVNSLPWWNVRISPGSPKASFMDEDGTAWVPVRSARPTDTLGRVYNIGVREDESYMADGVVVHNCQDVSLAGRRAGMTEGTRSNLWGAMRSAVEIIRPTYVVAENVRGLLSAHAESASDMEPGPGLLGDRSGGHLRALGRVLGDLADLGYDTQWCGLRASDVGAPHHRFRVFILATRRDAPHPSSCGGRGRGAVPGTCPSGEPDATAHGADPRHGGTRADVGLVEGAQDADLATRRERGQSAPGQAQGGRARSDAGRRGGAPAPDADRGDDAGRVPDALRGALRGEAAPGGGGGVDFTDWGPYAAAVHRWAPVVGRCAPAPIELTERGKHRLSPRFTEWMMGLPDGWVTDTPGIKRNDALKMCGNGVVPQQASAALNHMLTTKEKP